jgi:hypothetical protein
VQGAILLLRENQVVVLDHKPLRYISLGKQQQTNQIVTNMMEPLGVRGGVLVLQLMVALAVEIKMLHFMREVVTI